MPSLTRGGLPHDGRLKDEMRWNRACSCRLTRRCSRWFRTWKTGREAVPTAASVTFTRRRPGSLVSGTTTCQKAAGILGAGGFKTLHYRKGFDGIDSKMRLPTDTIDVHACDVRACKSCMYVCACLRFGYVGRSRAIIISPLFPGLSPAPP
ncbi:hypothetical protein LY78DRAFT_228216 [Colletotrichum sublineola]|nr:hypothetical protein LY78DRAFT_228216 [Colletotrichum sublineola]